MAYGANSTFVFKTLSGGSGCNNEVFGDPVPGVAKACYIITPASSKWSTCANEDETCKFEGFGVVRFGTKGAFAYKQFNNGTSCNNGTFGDPKPGAVKKCDVIAAPPSGWRKCAKEGQNCKASGANFVAFGADGTFVYRAASGSTLCNNEVFGDPLPNVAKACYIVQ